MRRTYRWILLAAVAAALVAGVVALPVDAWLLDVVQWVRAAGPAGVAAFAGVYAAATLLMLPGSLLTAGAGFAYGPVWGTLLVSPLSVAAATGAFALGRTLARDWVARRIAAHPRFAAVDAAIADRGFKIVLLLRLSPLFPFNLLNYGLGLTRVRLRDYVFASWLGMLPGTALYVYLGSAVTSATELLGGNPQAAAAATPARQVLFWAGLAATLIATVLITRVARQALTRALADAAAAPPTPVPTQPAEARS